MPTLLPAQLDWRPLSDTLIDLWHPLRVALALADNDPEFPSADDLRDELAAEWLDLPDDTVIGFDAAGVARAYAMAEVRPGDTTLVRAWCPGGVHPSLRGQGIGRALLAWQRERAEQLVAARRQQVGAQVPATMLIDVPRGAPGKAALLARAGFSSSRISLVMRRSLAAPVEVLPDPDGIRIVPFDPALDEPMRQAHNVAFATHHAFQPWSAQTWQHWATGNQTFRPDWTFLALAGDEIAGYVVSQAFPQEWPILGFTQGYVAKLGTAPQWRSRGIATALLSRAMSAYAADGMEYAGLDVDAGNDTGALELYTRLGFEEWERTAMWDLAL